MTTAQAAAPHLGARHEIDRALAGLAIATTALEHAAALSADTTVAGAIAAARGECAVLSRRVERFTHFLPAQS